MILNRRKSTSSQVQIQEEPVPRMPSLPAFVSLLFRKSVWLMPVSTENEVKLDPSPFIADFKTTPEELGLLNSSQTDSILNLKLIPWIVLEKQWFYRQKNWYKPFLRYLVTKTPNSVKVLIQWSYIFWTILGMSY